MFFAASSVDFDDFLLNLLSTSTGEDDFYHHLLDRYSNIAWAGIKYQIVSRIFSIVENIIDEWTDMDSVNEAVQVVRVQNISYFLFEVFIYSFMQFFFFFIQ